MLLEHYTSFYNWYAALVCDDTSTNTQVGDDFGLQQG
jgi:hypothetical protein